MTDFGLNKNDNQKIERIINWIGKDCKVNNDEKCQKRYKFLLYFKNDKVYSKYWDDLFGKDNPKAIYQLGEPGIIERRVFDRLNKLFKIEKIKIDDLSENEQFESKQIYYSLPNPNIQNVTKSLKKTSSKSLQPLKQTKKVAIVTDFDNTITARNLFWFLHYESQPFDIFTGTLKDNKVDLNELKENVSFKLENMNRAEFKKGKYYNLYEKMKKMENLTTNEKQDLIELIFGGEKRFQELKNFLAEIRVYKIPVYISSHGFCSEINYVLDQLKLGNYFEKNMNCRENSQEPVPKDFKIDFIDSLIPEYDYIIYIDDADLYKDRIKNEKIYYFGDFIYSYKNGKLESEGDFGLKEENNGLIDKMFQKIIQKVKELQGSKKN
jgi:phosphoglycolate phosphatase-like HAD superfamily hydrolase